VGAGVGGAGVGSGVGGGGVGAGVGGVGPTGVGSGVGFFKIKNHQLKEKKKEFQPQ